MPSSSVHLCPDCDLLLQSVPRRAQRQRLRCPRCRRVLHQSRGSLAHCRAFTLAGLILYVPANFEPVLSIRIGRQESSNTVFSGVLELWNEELFVVATLVFLFAIIIPLLRLLALGFVLLPPALLKTKGLLLMRFHHALHGWGMMDIFLLGALVAVIKLQDFAEVGTGPGVYCLAGMMLMEVRASQLLPKNALWRKFGAIRK